MYDTAMYVQWQDLVLLHLSKLSKVLYKSLRFFDVPHSPLNMQCLPSNIMVEDILFHNNFIS